MNTEQRITAAQAILAALLSEATSRSNPTTTSSKISQEDHDTIWAGIPEGYQYLARPRGDHRFALYEVEPRPDGAGKWLGLGTSYFQLVSEESSYLSRYGVLHRIQQENLPPGVKVVDDTACLLKRTAAKPATVTAPVDPIAEWWKTVPKKYQFAAKDPSRLACGGSPWRLFRQRPTFGALDGWSTEFDGIGCGIGLLGSESAAVKEPPVDNMPPEKSLLIRPGTLAAGSGSTFTRLTEAQKTAIWADVGPNWVCVVFCPKPAEWLFFSEIPKREGDKWVPGPRAEYVSLSLMNAALRDEAVHARTNTLAALAASQPNLPWIVLRSGDARTASLEAAASKLPSPAPKPADPLAEWWETVPKQYVYAAEDCFGWFLFSAEPSFTTPPGKSTPGWWQSVKDGRLSSGHTHDTNPPVDTRSSCFEKSLLVRPGHKAPKTPEPVFRADAPEPRELTPAKFWQRAPKAALFATRSPDGLVSLWRYAPHRVFCGWGHALAEALVGSLPADAISEELLPKNHAKPLARPPMLRGHVEIPAWARYLAVVPAPHGACGNPTFESRVRRWYFTDTKPTFPTTKNGRRTYPDWGNGRGARVLGPRRSDPIWTKLREFGESTADRVLELVTNASVSRVYELKMSAPAATQPRVPETTMGQWWAKQPDWAKYAARDHDGRWFVFEKAPRTSMAKWVSDKPHDRYLHVADGCRPPVSVPEDWKLTLIQRPATAEAVDLNGWFALRDSCRDQNLLEIGRSTARRVHCADETAVGFLYGFSTLRILQVSRADLPRHFACGTTPDEALAKAIAS